MLAFKQKFKVWKWKILSYKLEDSSPLVTNEGQVGVIKASDQNKVFNTRAKGSMGARDAEKKFGLDRGRGNNYVEYDATMDEIEIINNQTTGAREYNIKGNVDLLERNPEYFKNR